MYRLDDVGSSFLSLPPNLQTAENRAYFYAVDRQLKRMLRLVDMLNVWGNLDKVNPRYYDALAACLRAPYYRSDCTDRQKLALIKGTLLTYRYAGTVRGVEQLLSAIFSCSEFIPWYKYGGRPYHFKVSATKPPSEEDNALFVEILRKIKAARSVLDYVEVAGGTVKTKAHVGIGVAIGKDIRIRKGAQNIRGDTTARLFIGIGAAAKREIRIGKGRGND